MGKTTDGGRTLSRRVVNVSSVGSFGIEEVALPNGKTATLAILKHPGAAAVVPFLDDDTVIMLHQYRHAAGGPIWEAPAGKLDPGEDPADCAARELQEETGYRAGRLELLGKMLSTPGFSDEVIYLFEARDLTAGERRLEGNEVIETHQIALEQVLGMVDRGEITDAKTIAALFHVARRIQR
jgi:ADP-ribose pyrophosphatase